MKRCLSSIALPILLSVASCGGGAPQRASDARHATNTKTSAPAPSPEVALPPDRPLTPAHLMLVTDFAFALRQTDTFPLANGGVGYLDASGSRMFGTLTELRRVANREKLRQLCVADDGKTTIALSQTPGSPAELRRADTFDGPMRVIGGYVTEVGAPRDRSIAYLVRDEKAGTQFVECRSGRVETVGPPMSNAYFLHSQSGIYVIRSYTAQGTQGVCYARTQATPWAKLSACQVQRRQDGTIAIDEVFPKKPSKCVFVLDAQGQRSPCDTPVGPAKPASAQAYAAEQHVRDARFFAPSKIVMPMKEGALFALGPNGSVEGAKRVGPESLVECNPLLPNAPLFHCVRDGELDVVVSVDPQGDAREEWQRGRRAERSDRESRGPAFHVTADGGVAVGGDCDGNLGDVVCMRSASGAWQNVELSKDLVSALARTAPATMLIPSPVGPLYVATGTADNLLGGNVRVLVFQADKGPASEIEKIPTWITASLSTLGGAQSGIASLLSYVVQGGHERAWAPQPTLSWTTSRRVRVWPMERQHPAFGTKEFCGLEVDVKGGFNADCVQGQVDAVGRRGLWEKRASSLLETLDAGKTWKPIELPKGADTVDVDCMPIGCRIGPYFRMGWGA